MSLDGHRDALLREKRNESVEVPRANIVALLFFRFYESMRHLKIARFVLLLCCGADIAVHRTCNENRKRKLCELYKYTVYLDVPDKWATNTQLDQLEGRFLDENDIEK